MNEKIGIRKLKPEDIKQVYNLGLDQFRGEYWFSKSFIQNTAETPGYDFVACDGDKIIGAIMVEIMDRPKMWVFFFVVDKKYRRRGIGSKLLKAVEKKCSKDFPLLFVDTGPNDIEANSFYKKHGYEEKARIDDWFNIGEAGIIYSKRVI